MAPSHDGRVPRAQVDAETVTQSIHRLRKSLTTISGYGQLLQRRTRHGECPTPEQVNRATAAIITASQEMVQDLNELEDACEE